MNKNQNIVIAILSVLVLISCCGMIALGALIVTGPSQNPFVMRDFWSVTKVPAATEAPVETKVPAATEAPVETAPMTIKVSGVSKDLYPGDSVATNDGSEAKGVQFFIDELPEGYSIVIAASSFAMTEGRGTQQDFKSCPVATISGPRTALSLGVYDGRVYIELTQKVIQKVAEIVPVQKAACGIEIIPITIPFK